MSNATGHIYTEKIHHLDCKVCGETINTNDGSHEMSKFEAAKSFIDNGWEYIFGLGWLCENCKGKIVWKKKKNNPA